MISFNSSAIPEEATALKEKREQHLQLLKGVEQIAKEIKDLEEESQLLNPDNNGEWEALSIRVNLPSNESNFYNGNGEGCWGVASSRVKKLHDSDERGGVYVALLNNTPFYEQWCHLKFGDPVLMTLRGECRPIAFLDQEAAVEKFLEQLNNQEEVVD